MSKSKSQAVSQYTNDPTLACTPQQLIFVQELVKGAYHRDAAKTAGFADWEREGSRLLRKPHIVAALQYLHREHEAAVKMSRQRVMEGMLEAIDMAKQMAEPSTMVTGWREIGKMCGYYAAEHKIHHHQHTAAQTVNKLETMSDSELLEMIEKDSEAIEGDFSEVLEDEVPAWQKAEAEQEEANAEESSDVGA